MHSTTPPVASVRHTLTPTGLAAVPARALRMAPNTTPRSGAATSCSTGSIPYEGPCRGLLTRAGEEYGTPASFLLQAAYDVIRRLGEKVVYVQHDSGTILSLPQGGELGHCTANEKRTGASATAISLGT
eukprot:scaffold290_cov364-Prasinococcus_capsulatus_cf.AAC.4